MISRTARVEIGGALYSGGAGNPPDIDPPHVHIKNPAGSGVLATFYRITIDNAQAGGSVPSEIVWGYYAPDLPGVPAYTGRAALDHRFTRASSCLIAVTVNPLILPTQILGRTPVAVGANFIDRRLTGEAIAIVPPGSGVLVVATIASVDLDAVFFWNETPIS